MWRNAAPADMPEKWSRKASPSSSRLQAREHRIPAEVITTGSDVPGIWLPECSADFRHRFAEADLVIVGDAFARPLLAAL